MCGLVHLLWEMIHEKTMIRDNVRQSSMAYQKGTEPSLII